MGKRVVSVSSVLRDLRSIQQAIEKKRAALIVAEYEIAQGIETLQKEQNDLSRSHRHG